MRVKAKPRQCPTMAPTRYFLFSRVNPRKKDYGLMITACKKIDAYFGYRTVSDGVKVLLKGFIVLRGRKTNVGRIVCYFPNFILKEVPRHFDFDLDDLPDDVVVGGHHPFGFLRRDLFKEKSLKKFFGNGDR